MRTSHRSTPADRPPPRRSRILGATRDDRGVVIPLVAIMLGVLVLMTAFAVDLGRQRDLRRTMQARADMVSLDLVRDIDGRTGSSETMSARACIVRDIDGRTACELGVWWDGDAPFAEDIADALVWSSERNDMDWSRITGAVWGYSDPVTGVFTPHHEPLVPPSQAVCDDEPIPNAVRILTGDVIDYVFHPGEGGANRDATASLADVGRAEFLMGSVFVSLSPGSSRVLGRMISSVFPGADLVGYEGLANARITLRRLAIELGLGSTEELLDATVSWQDLVLASAAALEAEGGDTAAVAVLNELYTYTVPGHSVPIGRTLGYITTEDPNSGLDGWVSVPQLLAAAVTTSNSDHFISIPNTFLNVAGLAEVRLDLQGIEAVQRVGTEDGAEGTTKQVDLGVAVDIGISADKNQRLCELPSDERTLLGQLIGGLFQTLNCLLAPLTEALLEVEVSGTIDMQMSLGEVWAQQHIDCEAGQLVIAYDALPVQILVTPNVNVSVRFNGSPFTLLGVTATPTSVTADGSAGAVTFQVTDEGPVHFAFERVFPDGSTGGSSARVGSPWLGLADMLQTSGVRVTVVNSDLPVTGGIARNLVQPTLNALLDEVDQHLLAQVSRLLGLNLGGADLTPQWMHCEGGRIRLVG